MRRVPGVLAPLRSVLLGLALVVAAQPGAVHAPLVPTRWAAAVRPADAGVAAPHIGKRWC